MIELLTDAEAASILRCSQQTFAKLRRSGRVAYLKGRPTLISTGDLRSYLKSIYKESASSGMTDAGLIDNHEGQGLLTEQEAAVHLGIDLTRLKYSRSRGRIAHYDCTRVLYSRSFFDRFLLAEDERRIERAYRNLKRRPQPGEPFYERHEAEKVARRIWVRRLRMRVKQLQQ